MSQWKKKKKLKIFSTKEMEFNFILDALLSENA